MEKLKITNFLCIKEAEIEIKKINLFIGPQAQGKSVIAKLIYFFKKNFFSESFITNLRQLEKKSELDKLFLSQFEKIFPRYAWEHQAFSIEYINEKYKVSIFRTKTNNRFKTKLSYWNKFSYLYKKSSLLYDELFNEIKIISPNGIDINNPIDTSRDDFRKGAEILKYIKKVKKRIEQPEINQAFTESIFIPAGRSFLVNLQKNIFSLLANDINIDYLIKDFGSQYEHTKEIPNTFLLDEFDVIFIESVRKKINTLISEIIGGEYIYEDRKDWILTDGKKTNLTNASSGQQESVPMLLTLTFFAFLYGKQDIATFFVEEPEAHLFPTSQKKIISLMATIYNTFGHSFFITTHSPYILTAFNNLIQAGNVAASKNYQNLEELYKVVPKDEIVYFNDVSAYLVNNGTVQSILDDELKLIDAAMIDGVSRQFSNTFEQLIMMEDEHD